MRRTGKGPGQGKGGLGGSGGPHSKVPKPTAAPGVRTLKVLVGPSDGASEQLASETKSEGPGTGAAGGSRTHNGALLDNAAAGAASGDLDAADTVLQASDSGSAASDSASGAAPSAAASGAAPSATAAHDPMTSMPVACLMNSFARQAITHPKGVPPTITWASSLRIQAMSIVIMVYTLFFAADIWDYKNLGGSSRSSAISGLQHIVVFVALLGCTAAWKLAALAGMPKSARGKRWETSKGMAYLRFVRAGLRGVMDADIRGNLSVAQAVAFVVAVLVAPLCAYAENRVLHFVWVVSARLHVAKRGKNKRGLAGGEVDGGNADLTDVMQFLSEMKKFVKFNIEDPHTVLAHAFQDRFENTLKVRRANLHYTQCSGAVVIDVV